MEFPVPLPGGGYSALAADTVESITIPKRGRIARLVLSTAARYTLGGTDPTAALGFPLGAGTHDITVAGATLKLFETGGAGNVYVEFYGADKTPVPVRIKGAHEQIALSDNNAVTISTDARKLATYILLRATHPFFFSTDGVDPTADRGIYIAANTNVIVPSFRGTVKIRRATGSATLVEVQAFQEIKADGNLYEQDFSIPRGGHYVAIANANVVQVDVPLNAKWAWISAQDQAVKYSTNGVDPTGSQRGFTVGANANARVPIAGGTNNLRLIRGAAGAKATIMFFGK